MSDLPTELIREILSRATVDVLIRLRCACKAWREIIDDPDFGQVHHHCQLDGNQLLLRNKDCTGICTLSLESLNCSENCKKSVEAMRIKMPLNKNPSPKNYCLPDLPIALCNGLILISYYYWIWVLWNPFTGESLELPSYKDITSKPLEYKSCSGLGYDSSSNDYKIVRIVQLSTSLETLVYSLKLNRWKRIGIFSNCRIPGAYVSGVFVNGGLHWVTEVIDRLGEAVELIMVFHLDTETYSLLSLPSALTARAHPFENNLDVLDGCLFLSCFCRKNYLDGWIMKSYGDNNSWIKLFSFTSLYDIGVFGILKPISYLKNEKQVIIHHGPGGEFFLFDVDKRCAKKVTISGLSGHISSQVFRASLIRLRKNVGDDGSIILATKERRDMKLTIKTKDWNSINVDTNEYDRIVTLSLFFVATLYVPDIFNLISHLF